MGRDKFAHKHLTTDVNFPFFNGVHIVLKRVLKPSFPNWRWFNLACRQSSLTDFAVNMTYFCRNPNVSALVPQICLDFGLIFKQTQKLAWSVDRIFLGAEYSQLKST